MVGRTAKLPELVAFRNCEEIQEYESLSTPRITEEVSRVGGVRRVGEFRGVKGVGGISRVNRVRRVGRVPIAKQYTSFFTAFSAFSVPSANTW